MRTNVPLAVLAWLGSIALIVGVIMVSANQGSDGYPRKSPNYELIWSGAGIAGFGAMVIVIALAVMAIRFDGRPKASR